jgi:CDP-glycerol glycerophosphotransferase
MDYKISVIVPGYNVAKYIRQCLDSLVNQSFKQIQVIMVDDGSPDMETGRIMDDYASKYTNFQVVHQENKGLGAARNTGIKYAEGAYIAFVDSDDYLSLDAYEVMYRMAEHTHSDIIVGGVNRFNSKKNIKSWLHKKAIFDTQERTHITKNPELLYDTTSWNKLYKRSFWNKHHLAFPEGMLYEDIPVTIPAHFLAESVDIIEQTVYYWRIREDDISITQGKNNINSFKDRMKALHMLNDFMSEHHVSEKMRRANQIKYLMVDFYIHLRDLQFTDSVYINQFQKLLADELSKVDPDLLKRIPARQALAYQFVLQNTMEDVIGVIKLNRRHTLNVKPYCENGHWYKKFTISEAAETHPVCVDDSLVAVSQVHKIQWNDEGELEITGHAYIEGIDSRRKSQVKITATLVNLENQKQLELPVLLTKDPGITRKWGTVKVHPINPLHRVYNYNWSSFSLKLHADECLNVLDTGRWTIYVTVIAQGVKKTVRLVHPLAQGTDVNFMIRQDLAWTIKRNGRSELAIDVHKPDVLIKDGYVKDNQLIIIGQTNKDIADLCLSYFNTKTNELSCFIPEIHYARKNQFELIIPNDKMREMVFDQTGWQIGYHLHGESVPYPAYADFTNSSQMFTLHKRHVWLENYEGLITIFASKDRHPIAQYLSLSGSTMDIELSLPAELSSLLKNSDKKRLVFESQNNGAPVVVDFPDTHASNNYRIRFDFLDQNGDFKLFTAGKWNVSVEVLGMTAEGKKYAVKCPVVFSKVLSETSDFHYSFKKKLSFSAEHGMHDALNFSTKISWGMVDQTTRRRKFVKWYLYPLMRLLPIKKNVVVFESFWGKSFNDNPKAIYDHMRQTYGNKYKYVWFLNNEYTPVTSPAIAVRKNSWRYFYYLARGKYFVENANFPNFYVKRKGQIEMQTLHGTFMKTMGLDEKVTFNTRSKQGALLKRSGRWDYLISPSPYMTEIAGRAFLFEHKMLECGFPRNDVLYLNNNPSSIHDIKKKLDLPADKKVILYAPTFRSKETFDLHLDFDQLQDKLGSDYIVLLRLHYFISSRIDVENYRGFVYDVSSYPDIQDLYLISDLMITDYSSVMFDFAHLRRPMLFFAYDLDYYRNDLRGMYLDYEETVPGPIVQNTEEIINHIMNLPESPEHEQKYEQFYNKFCAFGRGDSAKKAAEQLLDPNIELQDGEPFFRNFLKKKTSFVYPTLFRRIGKLPRRKTVLFESFFGQQYSDNPRAIYEYMRDNHPEYRLIWNAQKGYEDVFKKEKVPYVIKYSYRGLLQWARAKYWVNNSRWPLWLPKPQGTVYVQTWHGTPLKTLGADIEHITMPGMTLEKYHSQFTKEARKWDYCVAPNAYSSEIFHRAFEVQGEMINSGYPRNDLLYQKNNPQEISRIKTKLKIPLEKKVVLYAPTWRDNEYKKIGHYTFDLKLDLNRIREKFGKNTVLLLRLHYLIAEQIDLSDFEDFAINVSDYTDLRELYLVSDCLITDYSSVFFDYANLKRPIVFYAYDLDDYANEIRGFYFDFEKEAPGPIVKDMDHLLPAVEEALAYTGNNPYPEFYDRFCQWEDGHSSERVVQAMLQNGKSIESDHAIMTTQIDGQTHSKA